MIPKLFAPYAIPIYITSYQMGLVLPHPDTIWIQIPFLSSAQLQGVTFVLLLLFVLSVLQLTTFKWMGVEIVSVTAPKTLFFLLKLAFVTQVITFKTIHVSLCLFVQLQTVAVQTVLDQSVHLVILQLDLYPYLLIVSVLMNIILTELNVYDVMIPMLPVKHVSQLIYVQAAWITLL